MLQRLFKRSREIRASIPRPCQETWDAAMAATGNGRFCDKCQHQVIDFTILTRKQAQHIFRSATGRGCGRLATDAKGKAVFRPEPPSGTLVRIAGLSVAAASTVAAQSQCEVQVNVHSGGTPIEHAKVSVKPGGRVPATGAPGIHAVKLAPGRYKVEAGARDFGKVTKQITVDCRDEKTPMLVDAELPLTVTVGEVMLF